MFGAFGSLLIEIPFGLHAVAEAEFEHRQVAFPPFKVGLFDASIESSSHAPALAEMAVEIERLSLLVRTCLSLCLS